MKPSLAIQIQTTKNQLGRAKPHSRRRLELTVRIRELMTRALRQEIRHGRITA
jgi:hypothetical protein